MKHAAQPPVLAKPIVMSDILEAQDRLQRCIENQKYLKSAIHEAGEKVTEWQGVVAKREAALQREAEAEPRLRENLERLKKQQIANTVAEREALLAKKKAIEEQLRLLAADVGAGS